ncbi:MAG: hypothetical protein JRN68_06375 [Nitrososphaerota archaeon]|nr:hypothetical protein [Ferrimicrobium acidiphilum]MDG6934307.1 hypothetical protein [Nitrososphaerota archaeon]
MVHERSEGHPYMIQVFGLYAFDEASKATSKTVDLAVIQRVLPLVIYRLGGRPSGTNSRRRVLPSGRSYWPLRERVNLKSLPRGQSPHGRERQNRWRSAGSEEAGEEELPSQERKGTYSFFTLLFDEHAKAETP